MVRELNCPEEKENGVSLSFQIEIPVFSFISCHFKDYSQERFDTWLVTCRSKRVVFQPTISVTKH